MCLLPLNEFTGWTHIHWYQPCHKEVSEPINGANKRNECSDWVVEVMRANERSERLSGLLKHGYRWPGMRPLWKLQEMYKAFTIAVNIKSSNHVDIWERGTWVSVRYEPLGRWFSRLDPRPGIRLHRRCSSTTNSPSESSTSKSTLETPAMPTMQLLRHLLK